MVEARLSSVACILKGVRTPDGAKGVAAEVEKDSEPFLLGRRRTSCGLSLYCGALSLAKSSRSIFPGAMILSLSHGCGTAAMAFCIIICIMIERTEMKMTRRLMSLLLAAVMIFALAACGSSQTEATEAPATEETGESVAAEDTADSGEVLQFRVGMECAYAPSNWQEDTASDTNYPIENVPGAYAEGYDVQIAKHIADSLGRELVIVKLAWTGLIEALNQGQIDAIIAGMADTEERRQSINFSDPYHVTVYGLMTLPDSPYAGGTTINDFSGASILGQKDTMLDTVIDQMEGVNHLPPVDSVPNMISRLDQGTCDAIVINLENAPGYLELNPDYNVIEFAEGDGFDLGFNGSCVGLRKSDDQLLADVNAALATYTQEDFDELWSWAVENQPN